MTKVKITQKDGVVQVREKYSDDLLWTYDFNQKEKPSAVALANMVAEVINDCLNCKKATSELHDLNDTKSYYGTSFEYIS